MEMTPDNLPFLVVVASCALLSVIALAVAIFKSKSVDNKKTRSVSRILFLSSQVASLFWVSVSYGIAVYSTVILSQPFPVVELSQQAITTILGVNVMKVAENVFEHNDGVVFGKSDKGVSE